MVIFCCHGSATIALSSSSQASVTSVLALASDCSLAAAAIDILPVNSPLRSLATCRSVSAVRENAPLSPTPPSPLDRLSRGLSGDARIQQQRFNVLRESASGDRLVLVVQPCTAVPGKNPRNSANLDAVTGTSPRDLRSTILSLLLESNPEPLPVIDGSLPASAIAAASTQQHHLAQVPSSAMASARFPRLAAILQLDTVAALAIFGRLFTAASDAVHACVWLAEGFPGVIARQRCLPGEWPALAVSAETVDIRIQAPKLSADQQADAPSKEPPTLQSILQAIAVIELSMAVSERQCTCPVGGASAAFRSGDTVQSLSNEADALDLSASSVSPRLGLLLLFIAFQICRNGPGVPPVVFVECDDAAVGSRGVIASAVRLAALYLCSPAPHGVKVPTNSDVPHCSGSNTDACSVLSDSSWVLHDDVITLFVSFTSRRVRSPVAAAWDVHSDDELFFWNDAQGCSTPAPTAMSRREELLVRLLRAVPVSSELRAALAERASAAGQFTALAVLRALEGDAVAVTDAFLQASLRR